MLSLVGGFQSTLPHGERLAFLPGNDGHLLVSIHAPARGATVVVSAIPDLAPVSIHAPARGATTPCTDNLIGDRFQSTLPHGERPGCCLRTRWKPCFNPRSRTGSDSRFRAARPRHIQFQSTLPHGERRYDASDVRLEQHVSIHAPARGATRPPRGGFLLETVSIHAPARGATKELFAAAQTHGVSIHAPARGATYIYPCGSDTDAFQSTLPHGERPTA